MAQTIMRAAIAGFRAIPGDTAHNLRTAGEVLAAHAGVDLFVLPELCLCGMPKGNDLDAVSKLAEEVPGGPSAKQMQALAKQYRTTVCAGIVEVEDHHFFLTHFLCGLEGYIGKQRKLFPSRGLSQVGAIEGGQGLHLMTIFGIRCAIVACADWVLPEAPYIAALHDTVLLLAPTDAYAMADITILHHLAIARALDTGAYLIVSFGGQATGEHLVPSGLVAKRDGQTLLESREPDEVKVMVLDLDIEPPPRRFGSARDRVHVMRHAVSSQITAQHAHH